MRISEKSIKLLWSNAAGRCSFSQCNERLSVGEAAEFAPYTLGEMAHIKGKKPNSKRYDKNQSCKKRNGYENLILLCPTHHTLIDKTENEERFSVEVLLKMKANHEAEIANKLNDFEIESLAQLKDQLAIYLAENCQAWEQYGPISENAMKHPNSDELYALWKSARLSTIVPNNRKVKNILKKNRQLFSRSEQRQVSKFIIHVDSYEKWVKDEIPYKAVVRFPKEFEDLIIGTEYVRT